MAAPMTGARASAARRARLQRSAAEPRCSPSTHQPLRRKLLPPQLVAPRGGPPSSPGRCYHHRCRLAHRSRVADMAATTTRGNAADAATGKVTSELTRTAAYVCYERPGRYGRRQCPKPVDVGQVVIERPYYEDAIAEYRSPCASCDGLEVMTQHNLSTTIAPGGAPVRLRCMRQRDHFRY